MNDKPIHIAYADDHVAVRKGIITLLNHFGGISVDIEANNGRELISQLSVAKELPSICMLDINMPEMNGFDTIVEIKKKWPQMKVLVLTTFDAELYVLKMIRNGANGYLLKSCDPAEIKTALLSIQHKGAYHSTFVTSQLTNALQDDRMNLPTLTEKELVLLKHSCTDLTYADIARIMKTTARSVEGYRDSLFRKLQVNSRVSLALYAVQVGIVPLEIANNG